MITRNQARSRRRARLRKKVRGSADRPRLAVFRSARHIYVQVVDDDDGRTLVAASDREATLRDEVKSLKKRESAKRVGQTIAAKCKEKGISRVVFDRAGYQYHGRVVALADGAREGGLDF